MQDKQDNFSRIKDKWQEIMLHVKEDHELSDISYNTWLTKIQPFAMEKNKLTIVGPDSMFLNYIKKKYSIFIQIGIEDITGLTCDLEFLSEEEAKNLKKTSKAPGKEKSLDARVAEARLNPRYTFETFVVGKNNNFAHAAAVAVAESPGTMYNPLFIYGGVGLGKTHLMHSIGHFILKNNSAAKVLYVTSEAFTNELIDAIRNKNNISTTEFREKYRNNDVLLIDDIQFIIGKESTQEEFFHTFNALYEAKKQIVISSDKPPKEFETLEERLRSRFEQGLTVDITLPDYETRMAILRKKEELEGINIDNEVIKYIATNVKSNIRELEGALTKVVALGRLSNQEITLELAEEVLKDLISPNEKKIVTPELIVQVVAEHCNVSPEDIISQKRSREITVPRQICMYLCRKLTNTPLKAIGDYLGGRDHSTIMHGANKIKNDLSDNDELRGNIEVILKKLNIKP